MKRFTEDGVRENYAKPYMGVNEFLDGLTNDDNKLFFPEFIEHNYWTKRFLAWSEGGNNYTEDELELFGFTKENAPKIDINPDLLSFKPDESWTPEEVKEFKPSIVFPNNNHLA